MSAAPIRIVLRRGSEVSMWLSLVRVVVVVLAHAGTPIARCERQPWLGLALGVVAALGLIVLERQAPVPSPATISSAR